MQLQTMPTPAAPTHLPEASFLAADPHMVRIRELAERVAPTGAPALIVGESGTGKEVLARFIHAASERHGYPFDKVNCAAIPSEMLEAELFGQEGRPAAASASADAPSHRAGKLELARRGTLLIDEIGEMSLALQAKLLPVLVVGAFRRLGGD
jgi:transcriptional regulator with PAS, ATPase and Fis domain